VVTVRHGQERACERLIRRLIKRMEKLEIAGLVKHGLARPSSLHRVFDAGQVPDDTCDYLTRAREAFGALQSKAASPSQKQIVR
jgi:hypothetical protein